MMNRPYYKGKPFATIDALARKLGIPYRTLMWAVGSAEHLYKPGAPTTKSDGSERPVFNPCRTLKFIQRRINKYIFENVYYPDYLQGGVKDPTSPRDYVRNAGLHAGAKVIIKEDISNFFPAITRQQIKAVFQFFFSFPPDVAECLTSLTSYNGNLPQGAPTSSYLSNLLFWDVEPDMELKFRRIGLRYSRYMDDITISSHRNLMCIDKSKIVCEVRAMCKKKDCRLKKSKHRIESASGRMQIHRLIVNKKASLRKEERARIRAAVHELSHIPVSERSSPEYARMFSRVQGRVGLLARLHPKLGGQYKLRLLEMKPIRD